MEHSGGGRVGRDPHVNPRTDSGGLFTAEAAQVRWLSDRILQWTGRRAPARVLDIGCGDGSLVEYLAPLLPAATFLGLDLSNVNVAAARERLGSSPARDRVTIERADYLALDAGRFDLVIASSTLQGIQTSTRQLAAKLAADTAPAGVLIHVTPYRCAYNTWLNMGRRMLRLMRGHVTDWIILSTARALHPNHPVERLRQRVDYMYLVLRHSEDRLRTELESHHRFSCLHREPAPHTSAGQPKHRLAVLSAPPE